jgi:hypothetical protein
MGDGKLNLNFAPSEAGFSDLYYLAELDQGEIAKVNMPVSVKLEYYLDGKKVKPSEIAGKDGHIKIVCQVENMTGEKEMVQLKDSKGQPVEQEMMVYTPYAVSLSVGSLIMTCLPTLRPLGWQANHRRVLLPISRECPRSPGLFP